jgi:hypothetical protein
MSALFCKRLPLCGDRPVLGELSVGDGSGRRIAVATVPSALTLLPTDGAGAPIRFIFDSPPVCVSQCSESELIGEFTVLCEDGAMWRCGAANNGQGAPKKPKASKPRSDATPPAFTVEGDTRVPPRCDSGTCTRVAQAHRGSTILLASASGAALVAAPLPDGAVTVLSFPPGSCTAPVGSTPNPPALAYLAAKGGKVWSPLCFMLRCSAKGAKGAAGAGDFAARGDVAGGSAAELNDALFAALFGQDTAGELARGGANLPGSPNPSCGPGANSCRSWP